MAALNSVLARFFSAGFHVVRWSDANLSYVAVSDIDEKGLAAFVEAFRQARKPAGVDGPVPRAGKTSRPVAPLAQFLSLA